MIRKLTVEGFKSLLKVSLEFRRLTILVGGNASGKSSAIQALLLLRQSCEAGEIVGRLKLTGTLYEAGTADDVVHPLATLEKDGNRILSILLDNQLDDQGGTREEIAYRFRYNRGPDAVSDRVLESIDGIERRLQIPVRPSTNGDYFGYLSAERLGPRVFYPLPSADPLAGPVGKNGEYTTAFLARALKEDRMVDPHVEARLALARVNLTQAPTLECVVDEAPDTSTATDNRLTTIANRALFWIIPGAWFKVEEHTSVDAAQLSFHRMDRQNPKPERPTHVGFGLSYALPIIVGALGVNSGGILIAENAESHLHPLSQSRMGVFLAIASSVGPQVLIETHSDHVINGIRLAVKFGLINASDVIFHYFQKTTGGVSTEVKPVEVDSDGVLKEWPVGFLDQIANDLSRL